MFAISVFLSFSPPPTETNLEEITRHHHISKSNSQFSMLFLLEKLITLSFWKCFVLSSAHHTLLARSLVCGRPYLGSIHRTKNPGRFDPGPPNIILKCSGYNLKSFIIPQMGKIWKWRRKINRCQYIILYNSEYMEGKYLL